MEPGQTGQDLAGRRDPPPRMTAGLVATCFALLMLWLPLPAQAGSARFDYEARIEASARQLDASIELTLAAEAPVYNAGLVIRSTDRVTRVEGPRTWQPGQAFPVQVQVPAGHPLPGRYHLLVSIEYQDENKAWHGFPFGIEYAFGAAPQAPRRGPEVTLKGERLRWQMAGIAPNEISLTLTAAPAWELAEPVRPGNRVFRLEPRSDRVAAPGGLYPQLARLSWRDRGIHHSRLIPWTLRTDQSGHWLGYSGDSPRRGWWRSAAWLQAVAIAAAVLALGWSIVAFKRHWRAPGPGPESPLVSYTGWLLAAAICLWIADHTRLDLWLLPTWATGGDTASHILYANVFRDWVAQGKVSGWMPEVFMGFPAFRYYFPMPFVLGVLLSELLGLPVAFKLIAMLPAVLLPLATYAMGSLLAWPVAARILGAAGAAGFVLTTGTSIWGGNLMAQLSGEFAYSWGFLWTVIFWGVLGRALRTGGRLWILAALLEVLVALSHGYALLTAGFGAFLLPLLYRNWRQALPTVLQVHTLAFLLLGFWLIPLASNLPWTIPNDTSMWVDRWQTLWPRQLWPLVLGIPYLVAILVFSRSARSGLGFPLGVCVLGLTGFHIAQHLGLADIRFYPYAQWGAAVALAAGTGWLIHKWVPVAVLWAFSVVIALMFWWQPDIDDVENWSRWNLEGYEAKSTWPAYRAVADSLAGGLADPRVIFEHDPDNNDTGSTRTVEAMPLFGTRPVLEGLYMESAVSSAFIYQLQAEISNRPSSPLSRFPSSKGSVDAAVGHLQELYTDTLVLRSKQMKRRFGGDERFEVILREEPFLVLRLKRLQSQLVDIVDIPLEIKTRERWMESAFRRFRLAHPYTAREIYLASDQEWQAPAQTGSGEVRILRMDRERLVFETSAVGRPHIVRMTYHPKWKSLTGEPIFLTEPAFMLIVPGQSRVELRYESIGPDLIGAGLTLLGIAGIALLALFPRVSPGPVMVKAPALKPVLLVALLALGLSGWGWWNNPERIYQRGHELRQNERYLAASEAFDRAYNTRHVPGHKAEALFWAGRSLEFAEDHAGALHRYRELVSLFPDNYWAPESLYRIVLLEKQAENGPGAEGAYRRLLEDYPGNAWTRKAIEASGGKP